MKRFLSVLCLSAVLFSCSDSTATTTDADAKDSSSAVTTAPVVSADTVIAGCYLYTSGRDTISFQLDRQGENLRGPLSFNYYEKDRNDGNFEGAADGDLISGYYLFRSEGVMSVRQELFRYSNSQLIPASGEVIQRNDSTIYKDPASVKFDTSRALKKVPCML